MNSRTLIIINTAILVCSVIILIWNVVVVNNYFSQAIYNSDKYNNNRLIDYDSTFIRYAKIIGYHESSDIWDTISKYGMLGKFQFDKKTITNLFSEKNFDIEYFLSDTVLQMSILKYLIYYNRKTFSKWFLLYEGKKVKDFVITELGLIYCFHINPSATISYLRNGCRYDIVMDKNNVTVENTLRKIYKKYINDKK